MPGAGMIAVSSAERVAALVWQADADTECGETRIVTQRLQLRGIQVDPHPLRAEGCHAVEGVQRASAVAEAGEDQRLFVCECRMLNEGFSLLSSTGPRVRVAEEPLTLGIGNILEKPDRLVHPAYP